LGRAVRRLDDIDPVQHPGEPSSVATTFDGYPMAKAGQASRALTLAFVSAGFGALAGVVMITLLSGWVANFALRFSSPEYFAVYFLAFASFISMGAQSPFKTLVSMMLGFALASVGMDTVSGNLRLTFDIPELIKGVLPDRGHGPVRHRRAAC
jgi:putative tricarboxylic transport membrane protein